MELEITEKAPERIYNSFSGRREKFRNCNASVEYCDGYKIFWSYSTPVAVYDWELGEYFFTPKHNCSPTTCKQVLKWCGICSAERQRRIKAGALCRINH